MDGLNSPFIVPLGAFAVAIVAIVAGAATQAHNRRLKAEQRMAMLARGVPLAEIEATLDAGREFQQDRVASNPTRRMGNSRTTAMVLMSVGIGIILFGLALTVIVRERDVLVVAAAGLIPFTIGIGFLADYNIQRRDLERFQMEMEGLRKP